MEHIMLNSLKCFSTCDISDTLLNLGVTHGGFVPDIFQRTRPKMNQEMPIIGQAWTVEFLEKNADRQPDFSGHYIDQIPSSVALPPGSSAEGSRFPVIPILGAPSHLTNAIFGGIMALRASILGAPAVVVSGRIRDVEEMDSAESTAAIFSRGLSTVGAGASSKVVSIGKTCNITDFGVVTTGELVVIDDNGVVVIPHSVDLFTLVASMKKLTVQDDKVKESVKAGMSVQEAFNKWRTN